MRCGRASAAVSRTRPVNASPTGQREGAASEARCHAAANGTSKTGTRRRPRSQKIMGSAARARNQIGSLKTKWFIQEARNSNIQDSMKHQTQKLQAAPFDWIWVI